jgi:E3 ubiquitin-protein ligase HUWE1
MITRHAFDDKAVLRDIMRREIREWMNPERNKVTDVTHFVRQLRQMAYRDANTFLGAAEDECELVAANPPTSVFHVRHKNAGLKDDAADEAKDKKEEPTKETAPPASADPFKSSGIDTFETNPTMDFFISELGTAIRTIQKEEAAFRTGTPYTDDAAEAYSYAGLVLSLITELVGSYFSAKKAFMASVRHGGLYGKGKSGIAGVFNDLACCVTLTDVQQKTSGSNGPNEIRRLTLSSWATSLIVALCANITPTSDIKDLPEDLTIVRKAVLDGVAKAFKDTPSATPDPSARYGRLWALGELVFRLLTASPTVVPTAPDDSSLHLAKTMLEKNFVSLMTLAVSEIDLNYPDIRDVLVSLLRALEHLTKISIKWGKTDNKQKDKLEEVDEEDESISDEDSDITMSEEEADDAPDLYRNSALGILGGDIDIDDDESDMDEDDLDEDELVSFEYAYRC